MTIKVLNPREATEFKKRFPNLGTTKKKYDWESLVEIGSGFPISKTEMPSVNYSGPSLPEDKIKQGWKISCLKTGDPEIPLWIERIA